LTSAVASRSLYTLSPEQSKNRTVEWRETGTGAACRRFFAGSAFGDRWPAARLFVEPVSQWPRKPS
jgi:hypothetical protein